MMDKNILKIYSYYITVNFVIEWNENRRFENAAVTKKIINCENTLKPRKRKLSVVKENATKYAHSVLFSIKNFKLQKSKMGET